MRRLSVVTLALASVVPLACGTPESASLCTAFGELLAANDAIRAIQPADLDDTTAADVEEAVESYLAGVRRLEQAADGRYGQELDILETAVNDLLLTLQSVPDDADFATWAPLIEDDFELAANATVTVEDSIGPSCPAAVSGTSESSEASGTSGT